MCFSLSLSLSLSPSFPTRAIVWILKSPKGPCNIGLVPSLVLKECSRNLKRWGPSGRSCNHWGQVIEGDSVNPILSSSFFLLSHEVNGLFHYNTSTMMCHLTTGTKHRVNQSQSESFQTIN
jgi:hypothetical protein